MVPTRRRAAASSGSVKRKRSASRIGLGLGLGCRGWRSAAGGGELHSGWSGIGHAPLLGKARRGVSSTPSGRFYGMGQGSPRLCLGRTYSAVDPGGGPGAWGLSRGSPGSVGRDPSRGPPPRACRQGGRDRPGIGKATTTRPRAGLSTLAVQILGPGYRDLTSNAEPPQGGRHHDREGGILTSNKGGKLGEQLTRGRGEWWSCRMSRLPVGAQTAVRRS